MFPRTLFFSVILLAASQTLAQRRVEAGVFYAPGFSTLNYSDDNFEVFDHALFHSFGAKISFTLNKKIRLHTGLILLNQGAVQRDLETTTPDQPEGTGEFFDFRFLYRSICVPLTASVGLVDNQKIRLSVDAGFLNGWQLKQAVKVTSGNVADQGYTDVDVYNKYYLALNPGVGLDVRVGQKAVLNFRPNFRYHLNAYKIGDVKSRIVSFALDAGFCLVFGKEN